MSRKTKRRKEDICEDFCFSCKDGGVCRICDQTGCLKTYHPDCLGKDDSFMESEDRWYCPWHFCFSFDCLKSSKFRCLCCPRAMCGKCIYMGEFVIIKGRMGLCFNCLKLASVIEGISPDDTDRANVNFEDEKKHEFFFVKYWEYISKKEGLNRECLHSAYISMKNNQNSTSNWRLLDIGKITENVSESEEDSFFAVSDYDDSEEVEEYRPARKRRTQSKRNSRYVKKEERSKRKVFDGWGSKSLLEFLASVGKDTSKPMEGYEVENIVKKYCKENNLFKKNTITCDEKLYLLLGKKTLSKNRLIELLTEHFASNNDRSTDDGTLSSSDDEDLIGNITRKKSLDSPRKTEKAKAIPNVQQSCYALVNTVNIKLVYLKRSLMEDLLKKLDEFNKKVVGSFVRVKCNPNDYTQKNSHQLLQVTSIAASSIGQILLQFSDCPEDFPVHKLSDDDFTEAECEDLRSRIKDGFLKKPTVVELEQKARSLHIDMINHWIPRELDLLRRRVDQASEKGWKRELSGYLERIKLLEDESHRQSLLNDFPKIIPEPVVQDLPESPVRSTLPHFLDSDFEFDSDTLTYQSESDNKNNHPVTSAQEKPPQECHVLAEEVPDNAHEEKVHQPASEIKSGCCKTVFPKVSPQNCQASSFEGQTKTNSLPQPQSSSSFAIGEEKTNQLNDKKITTEYQSALKVEVIELSDDEPEEISVDTRLKPLKDLEIPREGYSSKESPRSLNDKNLVSSGVEPSTGKVEIGHESLGDDNSSLWYCRSSRGHRAGPLKMTSLKKILEIKDIKVMVWKKGWSEEEAILLEEAIFGI